MHTKIIKKELSKYLPIIILLFTVLRILAGLRIPYLILADQRYDDRMMFENAYDLLSGLWLGNYDSYTLARGIGYPLFLVLSKKLCLPYSVLLALLQAAADRGELTLKQDGAIYFSSQSREILPGEIPGVLSDTLQNVWNIAGYTDCALSSTAKSTGRLSDIRRMEAFTSCLAVYPTLSHFEADDYDSIDDETLYDFNEIYSSGMVSLLNKCNSIYRALGRLVFLPALFCLCVLTALVIGGILHEDSAYLELWILTCGILLSAVLLRFGCSLFTGWFTEDMQKFINSFYSCGVYILLQMFKYLAIGTTLSAIGGKFHEKSRRTDQGVAENH